MRRSLIPLVVVAVTIFTALALVARQIYGDPCPPEGAGGDVDLNRLKNRTDSPRSSVRLTVGEISGLHSIRSHRRRAQWTRGDWRVIRDLEGAAVTVEGYVARTREEGPEATNCQDGHDIHLYLVDRSGDDARASVVAEITPRMRRPTWSASAIASLARHRSRVRVTGWLMYDQEHAPDAARATSWEIHPVTAVTVFVDGTWRDL